MASNLVKFITCTAAAFAANEHDANALYFVTDTQQLYKGDLLFSGGSFAAVSEFPETGVINTIYINTATGDVAYWNGTDYTDIVKTSSTIAENVDGDWEIKAGIPTCEAVFNFVEAANTALKTELSGTIEDLKNNVYTKTETDTAIANAVASAGHLKREIVDALPDVADGNEDTIYMVALADATGNNIYEEFMLINGSFEKIGSTDVDLTGYATETFVSEKVTSATESITTAYEAADATVLQDAKDYADSLADNYATAEQGAKADSALQPSDITTGDTEGTIFVDGLEVPVAGLGSAAFAKSSDFDAAGSADQALTDAKAYTDDAIANIELPDLPDSICTGIEEDSKKFLGQSAKTGYWDLSAKTTIEGTATVEKPTYVDAPLNFGAAASSDPAMAVYGVASDLSIRSADLSSWGISNDNNTVLDNLGTKANSILKSTITAREGIYFNSLSNDLSSTAISGLKAINSTSPGRNSSGSEQAVVGLQIYKKDTPTDENDDSWCEFYFFATDIGYTSEKCAVQAIPQTWTQHSSKLVKRYATSSKNIGVKCKVYYNFTDLMSTYTADQLLEIAPPEEVTIEGKLDSLLTTDHISREEPADLGIYDENGKLKVSTEAVKQIVVENSLSSETVDTKIDEAISEAIDPLIYCQAVGTDSQKFLSQSSTAEKWELNANTELVAKTSTGNSEPRDANISPTSLESYSEEEKVTKAMEVIGVTGDSYQQRIANLLSENPDIGYVDYIGTNSATFTPYKITFDKTGKLLLGIKSSVEGRPTTGFTVLSGPFTDYVVSLFDYPILDPKEVIPYEQYMYTIEQGDALLTTDHIARTEPSTLEVYDDNGKLKISENVIAAIAANALTWQEL